MSASSMKYRLGVVFFVFFWITATIPAPVLAEGETKPVISFVQENLSFGPPFPYSIDLAVNIKAIGENKVDLDIQLIQVTDEKGNNLSSSFAPSIEAVSCENQKEEKRVVTGLNEQVLTRKICLKTTGLEWGTYTALIQATLGDLAQATTTATLVAGPEVPVSILNSKITVLGTACPKFARAQAIKNLFCPNFGSYDVKVEKDTNILVITGYSGRDQEHLNKLFSRASGTLVSEDGAGIVNVRLGDTPEFKNCKDITDKRACSGARLLFSGSTKAGTYTGTFFLDTKDQSNENTKAEITIKVKDHIYIPTLTIILGLLVSAWITYRLGPQKENRDRRKADKAIKEKRDELQASLQALRKHVKIERPAYFVEDPDILAEVEFILHASIDESKNKLALIELSELAEQMTQIVPLFVRFWSFYSVLYDLHVWEDAHHAKLGTDDLRKAIEKARQEIWTADTNEKMDAAQDALTQALLIAHDSYRSNKNKLSPKAPPTFKVTPLTTHPIPETEQTEIEEQPKENVTIPDYILEKSVQWLIVLLSGVYVVYITNPTFGTPKDYIYAFLWGSAANGGIDFISKFFGANPSIMHVINNITK